MITMYNSKYHYCAACGRTVEHSPSRCPYQVIDRPTTLAVFIRRHGFPCRVMPNGDIRAAMSFGCPEHKGFHWQVETITSPTLSSVREWLGY